MSKPTIQTPHLYNPLLSYSIVVGLTVVVSCVALLWIAAPVQAADEAFQRCILQIGVQGVGNPPNINLSICCAAARNAGEEPPECGMEIGIDRPGSDLYPNGGYAQVGGGLPSTVQQGPPVLGVHFCTEKRRRGMLAKGCYSPKEGGLVLYFSDCAHEARYSNRAGTCRLLGRKSKDRA